VVVVAERWRRAKGRRGKSEVEQSDVRHQIDGGYMGAGYSQMPASGKAFLTHKGHPDGRGVQACSTEGCDHRQPPSLTSGCSKTAREQRLSFYHTSRTHSPQQTSSGITFVAVFGAISNETAVRRK